MPPKTLQALGEEKIKLIEEILDNNKNIYLLLSNKDLSKKIRDRLNFFFHDQIFLLDKLNKCSQYINHLRNEHKYTKEELLEIIKPE